MCFFVWTWNVEPRETLAGRMGSRRGADTCRQMSHLPPVVDRGSPEFHNGVLDPYGLNTCAFPFEEDL